MRHLATTGRILTVLAFLAAPLAASAQDPDPGVVLDTGSLQWEFFDNGELGAFADLGSLSFGTGMVFDGEPSALYEGTFLVGTNFQVSGEAYEVPQLMSLDAHEWVTVAPTSPIDPPGEFDDAYEAVYNDDNATGNGPLGLETTARAFAADGDNFIVNEFDVQNISGGDLGDVYIGIFADWDVGGDPAYLQNLCDFDEDTQLLYCWDSTGANPNYYGVAALDLEDEDHEVTGISYDVTPGDAQLFTGLTAAQTPPGGGADRRTVIGIGPFDIGSGETQRAAFAWVAGADEAAIIQAAADAQEKYLLPDVAIEPGPDGTPGTHALSAPSPNPFSARASFSLEVAESQNVRIAIYDALGREVSVVHDGTLAAGAVHALALDATSLPSGVYMIRVSGEQFSDMRQITLTR